MIHAPRTEGRFASHTAPTELKTPVKAPRGALGDDDPDVDASSEPTRRAKSAAAAAAADADAAADAEDATAHAAAAAAKGSTCPRISVVNSVAIFVASTAAAAAATAALFVAAAADATESVYPPLVEAVTLVVANVAKFSKSVFASRFGWNGRFATYTMGVSSGDSAPGSTISFASSPPSSLSAVDAVVTAVSFSASPLLLSPTSTVSDSVSTPLSRSKGFLRSAVIDATAAISAFPASNPAITLSTASVTFSTTCTICFEFLSISNATLQKNTGESSQSSHAGGGGTPSRVSNASAAAHVAEAKSSSVLPVSS